MSAPTYDDAQFLPGRPLYDRDGHRIGKISDVYVDAYAQRAQWAVVHTGLFGLRESFVPLDRLTFAEHGATVPFTKDHVKEAPHAEPEADLSAEEEERLYSHYELGAPPAAGDAGSSDAQRGADSGAAAADAGSADAATVPRSPDGGQPRQRRPSHLIRVTRHTVLAEQRRRAGESTQSHESGAGDQSWARRSF
jgi:sporulation protein YlmC with PRC-barrel domain